MSITKVTLENYKSHAHTEIPLGPITVLVGPNSAGKTTVLEAIHTVGKLADARSFGAKVDPDVVIRRESRSLRARLDLSGEGECFVEYSLERDGDAIRERCTWSTGTRRGSVEEPKGTLHADPRARQLLNDVFGAQGPMLLRLEPEELAAPNTVEVGANTTSLAPSGFGLAGVLAVAKLFSESDFDRIVVGLRKVVPTVESVRVVRTKFEQKQWDEHGENEHTVTVDGAELRFDFTGARDIPARAVSEGTLLALGLLTVVHFFPLPRVVLLDDLERALHPHGQRELVRLLRELVAEHSGLQIVATSHSPYLIDDFDATEVVVFALRSDGTPVARRLSEHPRAERMLQNLTTGEFLTTTNDAWLTAPEAANG